MTALGLRLERRHIAAAVSSDFAIAFENIRHVSSSKVLAEQTTVEYLKRLIQQCRPSVIACYAPATVEGTTRKLAQHCETVARDANVPFIRLNKPDVLSGFSLVPVRTRSALVDRIQAIVPEAFAQGTKKTLRVLKAEAVAAALLGELNHQLPPP